MNWRRSAIAAAFVIPVVGLFMFGLRHDPKDIPSPLPGKPAPDFALEVFAPGQPPLARPVGDTIRLASLRGNVVVLNFWASWCLACRDEHVTLSETARLYAGKPVRFVGSLYQDRTSAGTDWIAELGGQSYPSVNDPKSHTAIDYGLYGVPETFIVSPDGVIARKITGPADAALVTQVVDSLLAVSSGGGAAGGSP
jgi:cytochrome c biogenesis protein CcmG, thiol:disulfide interchange protein DsbE